VRAGYLTVRYAYWFSFHLFNFIRSHSRPAITASTGVRIRTSIAVIIIRARIHRPRIRLGSRHLVLRSSRILCPLLLLCSFAYCYVVMLASPVTTQLDPMATLLAVIVPNSGDHRRRLAFWTGVHRSFRANQIHIDESQCSGSISHFSNVE
jgi:hypothetical protein